MARSDPGLIRPPASCECGQPAAVVQIEVMAVETGNTRRGAFSQFGEVKGRARRLVLRPEYLFRRWLVSCSACHVGSERATA